MNFQNASLYKPIKLKLNYVCGSLIKIHTKHDANVSDIWNEF